MGIYQRKETGIYYLKIKEGAKYRRISLSTKNRYVAEQLYNAYLLDKVQNKINSQPFYHQQAYQQNTVQIPINIPIQHNIEKTYSEYLELCKNQNLSKDVIYAKTRLLSYLKSMKIKFVDEINQDMIINLVNTHKTETANKHLRNLKAFLNFCIKKKYYKRDDYETLDFLMTKQNVRETIITESDYKKLIDNANNDFRLYMMTLWETGCRPNEITGLKKSDIDFEKGSVKVYQTKTKKYKTVYLTDLLLKEFEKIERERMFHGYDKAKSYYGRIFKKLRDELGMNTEYCLYAFRHSFGTRILNKTKDIHLVSKLLGHSDISITAKHYINRSDEEIREKLIN
ncbi:MAG: tyrosine-type recombinase/integrase [Brevinema sp.]